ncbi:MAG: hypothetical protein ACFFDW_10040 [Candidatus Thorarchaeota archaeon]
MATDEEFCKTTFNEYKRAIALYFELPEIENNKKITFQNDNSKINIPKIGINFGLRIENEQIILANWILELPIKEREVVIQYLLAREIFREYIRILLPVTNNPLLPLIDVVNNIITFLWLADHEKYEQLLSPAVSNIRMRITLSGSKLFENHDWQWFLINTFTNKVEPNDIIQMLKEKFDFAIQNNLTLKQFEEAIIDWQSEFILKKDFSVLPIVMKKRFIELLKTMNSLGLQKSTAKNLEKLLKRSHNVIAIDFRKLYEEYEVFWNVEKNVLLLRLYPFFLRITFKEDKKRELLLQKLKTYKYFHFIMEGKNLKNELVISAFFNCPQITHNHLTSYLEELKRKESITDYYFQMIRREKLTSSISESIIKVSPNTYLDLLENPSNYSFQTLTLSDKIFNFNKLPRISKAVYEENLLKFLSIFRARYVQKGQYMVQSVKELYELFEHMNLKDYEEKREYYINQIENRCRRLKLIDYKLNIKDIMNYSKILFYEIFENPESKSLQLFISKLESFYSLIYCEFLDKVLIGFPQIPEDHDFNKFIEEQLIKSDFKFMSYYVRKNKEFYDHVSYDKLYDNNKDTWTY